MKLSRRHLVIGASSVVIGAVALIVGLWLGVPVALRWGLETVAAREIGRPIGVGDIRFNPFELRLDVRDLSIGGAAGEDQPLLAMDEVHAQISSRSIWRLAPIVRSLQVRTMRLNVVRLAPNRFNFTDIVERLAAKPSAGEPARFAVNNIELVDGAVAIDDRVVGKKHAVTEVGVGIPFVSSLADHEEIKVKPSFSARVNDTPFRVDGETLPFSDSLETSVTIRFTGLHLPTYLGYVPMQLQFSLPRGELDTDLRLAFRRAVAAQEGRPAQSARLLLTGRVAIRDLALLPDDLKEPLAEWRSLEVTLDEVEPLARSAKIASTTLTAPVVRATRRSDGTLAGVSSLAVSPQDDSPKGKAQEAPFSVSIGRLRVVDGTVHLRDDTVDFSRVVQAIAVEVDGFSNTGEAPATLTASAHTDDKAQLKLAGEIRPASLQAAVDATVESLPLAGVEPYLRLFTTATVQGELNLRARITTARAGDEIALEVAEGRLAARDLQIKGPRSNPAQLSAPKVEVAGIGVDLQRRTATIERATVTGARARAGRSSEGERFVDWQALMVEPPPKDAADRGRPWSMKLDEFEIVNAQVQAVDQAVQPTVTVALDRLDAVVRDIGTDLGNRMQVQLRAGLGGGTVQASGWLRAQPLEAELKIDAANVDVTALRPYLATYTSAVLASAAVSADGTLYFSAPGSSPAIRYEGGARVTNFAALTSGSESELARWQALALEAVRVDTSAQPPSVDIGGVKLSEFRARAILSPQGKLNLVEVFADPSAARSAERAPPAQAVAPRGAAAEQPVRIRIGGIEIMRGAVNFTDNFVRPNYTANLSELAGTIGELSSDRAALADISIRGRGDVASLIEIKGKFNPLVTPLALDLRGSTKNVEMPRLTPYSIKYAGRPITKGRLSMEVHYKVDNDKLQAENHLFLEQLTFGERVDSPTATELPVQLAVSLLQNSRGEIDINLPISGSLDDPQFSLGGLIGKAIVNLLTKVITAPFTALSAAFGGDEDLGHVEFAPGAATVAEAQSRKLETLAKALNDRPALRVEVAGRAQASVDSEALRQARFDARLRAAKVQELLRDGQSVNPATVTIAPEERERLIGRVYAEESIPDKPRNFIGMAKSIPAAEMEALIMSTITVTDEDLRQLANERASAVRDHLTEQGKVSPERLFLVAPLSDGSGDSKLPPTRVDFSLK